jgi:hypothetical protein
MGCQESQVLHRLGVITGERPQRARERAALPGAENLAET